VANVPSPQLSDRSLVEHRERVAADIVKVLGQVRAEIARARAILDRLGRERNADVHRSERRPLLIPHVDTKLGPTLFNDDKC
jgi:hypothetical protein